MKREYKNLEEALDGMEETMKVSDRIIRSTFVVLKISDARVKELEEWIRKQSVGKCPRCGIGLAPVILAGPRTYYARECRDKIGCCWKEGESGDYFSILEGEND